MKKYYQDNAAYVEMHTQDREKFVSIISEYGMFLFQSDRYENGTVYEEKVVCTEFEADADPAMNSLDFLGYQDPDTGFRSRVLLIGEFEYADFFFHTQGIIGSCFLKLRGVEEVEILLGSGPAAIAARLA